MKTLISVLAVLLIMASPSWAEFSEEDCVCGEDVSKGMEIANPNLQLSGLSGLTPQGAHIKIFSGLSVSDVTRMWNDFIYIRDFTEIRDIYMFINSPGGDAFSGMALADLIVQAQDDWGFTVHAQASGIIASAAVPVFVVCKVRTARPGTIFMVHEASLWKWPGRETASDIESQNNLMKLLRSMYLGYLVDNSNLSLDQWKVKEKTTTWFTVDTAKEWGLIERVVIEK